MNDTSITVSVDLYSEAGRSEVPEVLAKVVVYRYPPPAKKPEAERLKLYNLRNEVKPEEPSRSQRSCENN